jgi:hypothetical protein
MPSLCEVGLDLHSCVTHPPKKSKNEQRKRAFYYFSNNRRGRCFLRDDSASDLKRDE